MTEEKEVVQNTEQPAADAAPQAGAELNISDLNGLKSVIDVATQRGAFKANELEAVGKLYNRLSVFLESVTKKD
jgi:hypothetical protein